MPTLVKIIMCGSPTQVVSKVVKHGMLTVTLQRPLKGITDDHFTFTAVPQTVPIITAKGDTPTLA